MLDFNLVSALGLIVTIMILIGVVFPYMKKKGIKGDIYVDIKMGLLLFGYAFREEKVKQIAQILIGVVTSIEKLDIAPFEKKTEAVKEVFLELLEQLEIVLDDEAVEVLVNIAVAYLPKTNEE